MSDMQGLHIRHFGHIGHMYGPPTSSSLMYNTGTNLNRTSTNVRFGSAFVHWDLRRILS